jgi:hypothetical protein
MKKVIYYEFSSRGEALTFLNDLLDPNEFCPLLARPCTSGCTCFVKKRYDRVDVDDTVYHTVYSSYCGNEMFHKEVMFCLEGA